MNSTYSSICFKPQFQHFPLACWQLCHALVRPSGPAQQAVSHAHHLGEEDEQVRPVSSPREAVSCLNMDACHELTFYQLSGNALKAMSNASCHRMRVEEHLLSSSSSQRQAVPNEVSQNTQFYLGYQIKKSVIQSADKSSKTSKY